MTTNTTSMSADSAQSAHVPNAEELYRSLRGDILTSALAPGAVVSQVKLARQLGVNRTPLREALRMLQQEGLVEAEHNRRVRIAALSDEDLVDIYSLRILQEAVSIRVSLPRLTAARLRSLDQSITELEQFAAFELLDQWERSYSDFHRTPSPRVPASGSAPPSETSSRIPSAITARCSSSRRSTSCWAPVNCGRSRWPAPNATSAPLSSR